MYGQAALIPPDCSHCPSRIPAVAASMLPIAEAAWTVPKAWARARGGTTSATSATLTLTERGGKQLTLEVETLGYYALTCGTGYGGDPNWSHGSWKGTSWRQRVRRCAR